MYRFGLLLLILTTGACVSTRPSADLAENISLEQQQKLLAADVIFLGEQHDNPHHHTIQRQVLELLGQKSLLGSVVFEQVHWDQQPILASLNNRSLRHLAEDLKWSSSGWPDYHFYEPLFVTATRYRAQLIAGNVDPQKSKKVYHDGYAAIFSAEEQKALGLDQELEPQARENLEQEIFEGHCRMLPKDHIRGMIPVQRTRDAAMALAWSRLHKQGKSVFIVGAGHARKDFGIPWYLLRLKPDLKIYSIGMNETGTEAETGAYDHFIRTAPVDRGDPCAALKEKFSKPKS